MRANSPIVGELVRRQVYTGPKFAKPTNRHANLCGHVNPAQIYAIGSANPCTNPHIHTHTEPAHKTRKKHAQNRVHTCMSYHPMAAFSHVSNHQESTIFTGPPFESTFQDIPHQTHPGFRHPRPQTDPTPQRVVETLFKSPQTFSAKAETSILQHLRRLCLHLSLMFLVHLLVQAAPSCRSIEPI